MYENDGPLIRLARRAAVRPFDPERKEHGCRGKAKSLLCDQAPRRSFRHPIVLDHRVPTTPKGRSLRRLTARGSAECHRLSASLEPPDFVARG